MPESLIVALSRSESTELLICARWCGERSVFCVTEAAEADSFWLWIILLNFGGGALLIILIGGLFVYVKKQQKMKLRTMTSHKLKMVAESEQGASASVGLQWDPIIGLAYSKLCLNQKKWSIQAV